MIQPDANDLPDLVRELHRNRTAWVPCGLGSHLSWGAPLRQPCLAVSCAALSGIVEHNPGDFTLTVRAGTSLLEVQQALARHRQWLAVDWPWGCGDPPSAQAAGSLGGLVARGLAGGYRQRHLGIRDQLIGLALLRVDGVAARAGGRVVKNVAGYDLMRLFCGSWGSLGLITEVTLRTQPLPPARGGLLLQGDLTALDGLVRALLNSGLTPERLDWWSPALAVAAGLEPQAALLIALAGVSPASLREQTQLISGRSALACRPLAAAELPALLAWGRGGPGRPAVTPEAAANPEPPRWATASAEAGGASASPAGAEPTMSAAAAVSSELAAPMAPSVPAAPTGAPPLAGHGGEGGRGGAWLLRLGVRSDRVAALLALPELQGLAVELAAGSGIGQIWEIGRPGEGGLTPKRVRALRRHCAEAGGWLTVLQQPAGAGIEAWLDAPSRRQIEAVKQRFDPHGQLAPGRLPGVAWGVSGPLPLS
ncbi:MAG: FAD-binding protein [Cyanobium sp.]